jgi:colanic acid/amylovoran biosynthesis protein
MPLIAARLRRNGIDASAARSYADAVHEADLVMIPGGAWITDTFGDVSPRLVLETISIAQRAGKPTALLGQGMGPVEGPGLRRLAKEVLARVDLITVRERRVCLPLLRSLGIRPDRVLATGDETIEMAYAERPEERGDGIGVNIRVAPYSSVGADQCELVGACLAESAAALGAPLIPIPIEMIAEGDFRQDTESIALALRGRGGPVAEAPPPDTPLEVIRRVGRCRVVVTGSYHAGVFALSQGIPAVGLAASEHYVDKFLGLADMFGGGCETVRLDREDARDGLLHAIGEAWRSADDLRPQLLAAAARQVELGREAYRRLGAIVNA